MAKSMPRVRAKGKSDAQGPGKQEDAKSNANRHMHRVGTGAVVSRNRASTLISVNCCSENASLAFSETEHVPAVGEICAANMPILQ